MKYIFLFYLSILLLLTGCSGISYYSQSISGQMSILLKREELNSVINDVDTDNSVKITLQQVRKIRRFASQSLKLPNNQSYLYYVDLERPYVVWNVVAAPEFSLSPKKWCYPIVGCVSYRGYFALSDAEQHATKLKEQGLDVSVAGISAYSTLGWFDDPVLNTMLNWRDYTLASLIFHELSHQVIYISSETSFNEAFSTAVGRLGTIQWLLAHHPEKLSHYLSFLQAYSDFRQLLNKTHEQLNDVYSSGISDSEKRIKKQTVFNQLKLSYEQLKQQWPNGIHFNSWFSKSINNARFTSTMTYLQKVPAFYALFAESQGDWSKFYEKVIEMDDLDKAERDKLIDEKLAQTIQIEYLIEIIRENLKKNKQS